jgi:hypothetical protein
MTDPTHKVATIVTTVGHKVRLTRSDATLPYEDFASRESVLAKLLSEGWKIQSTNVAAGGGVVIVDTLVHFTPGSSAGLGIDY